MNHASTQLIPTEADRRSLFRALASWTGNATVAEDLVQQTLIEAWKSNRQPGHEEWRPWLFGIARNVLLRWRRELSSDLRHTVLLPESESVLFAASLDGDIDAELEQQEIVSLLHEMLDKLSPETRQILLLKYINELPQAEIAGRMGLHEKALEGRLHRGKQKLRQQVITHRPDTALELGIVSEANTWQSTNYWCRTCGRQQLLARWSDSGELWFDCPSCINGSRIRHYEGGLFRSHTPHRRPTFGKVMQYFQIQTEACGSAEPESPLPCPAECDGHLIRSVLDSANTALVVPQVAVYFDCQTCGCHLSFESIFETGIDTETGHGFLRQHQRVESIPPILSEYQGAAVVKSQWVAVDSRATFIAWYKADTGQLIDTTISQS